MFTRRRFVKTAGMAGAGMLLPWDKILRKANAQIPGGDLPLGDVFKFVRPLIKPPAMPITKRSNVDYYDIAVRQFQQEILPPGHPKTTVWSYGSVQYPQTFNYPAFTIEAKANRRVRVNWINELVDGEGNYLPHILPVDQTLHWANPPGPRDRRGNNPDPYMGPVPMVTHVHGAHTSQESDGYPEAWYLPDAKNIPNGYYETGTFYDTFKRSSPLGRTWKPGTAQFQYANDQPATTLWYHDHTLGMTRLNVYAGPAGYWLIRGGPYDMDLGYVAPGVGDDPFGEYTEIPIVIQDRSFNTDGSLFYPDNRAFFEGLDPSELQIPFIPEDACGGPSDISPIWNPEFFGNTMVVNGRTWPYLEVERRRYRFRFLNGCNSRFLDLKMTTAPRMTNGGFNDPEYSFWQIGAEQGFLPNAFELDHLLMAPAERADVIVDFTDIEADVVYLVNDGPDAPFGGISTEDISDHESTGLVMKFIVKDATNGDTTTLPYQLTELPTPPVLPPRDNLRKVSLNEEESRTVKVLLDEDGEYILPVKLACEEGAEPFAPAAALLGTLTNGSGNPLTWGDDTTENPRLGDTEEWEIHNFTEDAHPIHVHLVKFEVLGRGAEGTQPPEDWETGFKDTVIAYPGEITRIKAKFDLPGLFVWHCHIVEHEDNEMMRPYKVVAGA